MSQQGQIQNRERFLNNIANVLGRSRTKDVTKPVWKHQPQYEVFKDKTQDELVLELKQHCKKIHTDVKEATTANLRSTLLEVIAEFEGKSVITWNDKRFDDYGLSSMFKNDLPKQEIDVHIWDTSLGDENMEIAARADVGITFSDTTLAESGTVVLFSDKGKGRSVSLLPKTYIAIIPKTSIVPRMTQVATSVHDSIGVGKDVASCVNFISGPSNSADIEMNLIVGVHGPIKATYVIVSDQ